MPLRRLTSNLVPVMITAATPPGVRSKPLCLTEPSSTRMVSCMRSVTHDPESGGQTFGGGVRRSDRLCRRAAFSAARK